MTGKERVAAAMGGKAADRVPVFCQLSIGHYMLHSGVEPHRIWFSSEAFTDALVTLADRYRFDGVLVNLPGRPSNWESMISNIELGREGTRITWEGGGHSDCPRADNVHYFGGPSRHPGIEEVDPETLYYIEPHCITETTYPFSFDFQSPPTSRGPSFFPDYYLDSLKGAVEKCGDRLHISSEIFSPFTQLMELLGYTEGLVSLMDEAERCEAILAALSEGAAELAIMQAKVGADAVLISSAFAGGGFISLAQYRRFVLPYERFIIQRIHRETSVPVYVHTCGSIGDRIGAMVEAGYDGVDTMDPPPLGNTDILQVKGEFGDRLFLKGNLDPVNVLLNGPVDRIRAEAARLIAGAGAGGGYILSTACSVPPGTPPDHIAALARASSDSPY